MDGPANNHPDPLVSLIIPCFNERRHIEVVLENIIGQDYPAGRMEVWFVDGMSNDGTRDAILERISGMENMHLLDNPRRYVSQALNAGIRAASGEVIVIIGSHAVYPKNYTLTLVRNLIDLRADNVGAVMETLPVDSSRTAKAIAVAVSTPFGVGNSHFRLGSKNIRQVDTVPFGCYRREVFEKIGFFDEELIRNQDEEFNGRLIKAGGKIYLIPSIQIGYYTRDSVGGIIRMFYQYGLFKPLVGLKLKKPVTGRQFAPPLFVLFLVGMFPFLFFQRLFATVYLSGLALYLVTNVLFSLWASAKNRSLKLMFRLPWLYFLMHLSYGWGYLWGLFEFGLIGNRRKQVPPTRG